MKINHKQLETIVELVHDWSDFDVEVSGYRDYEITPYIDKSAMPRLHKTINKVLSPRKWWKFWQ